MPDTDVQDPQACLRDLQREHEFLIGFDSDGCVFDSMELKHKECFIPNIIRDWNLQPVSKYARAAAEFVNLYSKWRGCNRFVGLVHVFDLLLDWPEAMRRNPEIPEAKGLRDWIDAEPIVSNATLQAAIDRSQDPDLIRTLAWSKAVNASVESIAHGLSPFPFVRESMEKLKGKADALVVSSTPTEALNREWRDTDLDKYVRAIAGQEMGKKAEHLRLASGGHYAEGRVLMVGDAPGDRAAADAAGALFYPINPGHEDKSWQRFHDEALDRFFAGTYAGAYQAGLVEEFEALLPELPPWKQPH